MTIISINQGWQIPLRKKNFAAREGCIGKVNWLQLPPHSGNKTLAGTENQGYTKLITQYTK